MSATVTRRIAVCLGLVAGAFALALPLFAAAKGERQPVVHTVVIDASSFAPKFMRAKVGDRIVWVNKDLLVHTATAKRGAFDSKEIAAGKSWSYTVTAAGQLDYRCTLHPTMKGSLLVQ
ncbi:MAG TPA: cupredoxin family copper-binding protein [Thermoanaerobaculia bacterium]|nr:cupredoxin family copper-binding protein [Thermoanaerobaculia bacterium]